MYWDHVWASTTPGETTPSFKEPIVAKCPGCSREYTGPDYVSLPMVGYKVTGIDGILLELRNCRCNDDQLRFTISAIVRLGGFLTPDAYRLIEAREDEAEQVRSSELADDQKNGE